MIQPLVTSYELDPSRHRAGRLAVRVVATALSAGLAAFALTWIVLAWSTVAATAGWWFQHSDRLGVTSPLPSTAGISPVVAANHLVIPIIDVNAPVIYDTAITDAVGRLPEGVVHVRGTAEPGQPGNVFILGHSSGYWWQAGSYTQVFVLLDKLGPGDDLFIDRSGTTYRYRVTSREVVRPSAVDRLAQPTDRHELSLMTCVPVGTSLNRLIVHADLVSSVSATGSANSVPSTRS